MTVPPRDVTYPSSQFQQLQQNFECLLDLSSEKDVVPADYILYDLVEGMTLTMVNVTPSRKRQDTITHMKSSVCIRRSVVKDE